MWLNSTKVGQELKERLSKKPCMSFALSQNWSSLCLIWIHYPSPPSPDVPPSLALPRVGGCAKKWRKVFSCHGFVLPMSETALCSWKKLKLRCSSWRLVGDRHKTFGRWHFNFSEYFSKNLVPKIFVALLKEAKLNKQNKKVPEKQQQETKRKVPEKRRVKWV